MHLDAGGNLLFIDGSIQWIPKVGDSFEWETSYTNYMDAFSNSWETF